MFNYLWELGVNSLTSYRFTKPIQWGHPTLKGGKGDISPIYRRRSWANDGNDQVSHDPSKWIIIRFSTHPLSLLPDVMQWKPAHCLLTPPGSDYPIIMWKSVLVEFLGVSEFRNQVNCEQTFSSRVQVTFSQPTIWTTANQRSLCYFFAKKWNTPTRVLIKVDIYLELLDTLPKEEGLDFFHKVN